MQLRRFRLAALLTVTALAVGTLSACAPEPDPAPRWTDSASPEAAEPLFASDEEALAAAEAAYVAYQEVSNQIAREGGAGVERLEPLASLDVYEQEKEAFSQFLANGWSGQGGVAFDSMRLQQRDESAGVATITVYLCMDVSAARLVDSQANDVTPPERVSRTPIQATFVSSSVRSRELLLDQSDVWSGDNFC